MGKFNKKYAGVIAASALAVGAILVGVGAYAKANNPATDGQVNVNYEDDYYCNSVLMDVNNPTIANIYENYEKSELSLVANGSDISYTVNLNDASKIESVSSALSMTMDKEMNVEGDAWLYLGSKKDCEYDEATGKAVSKFDGKWLMLNGKIPVAMYNEDDENGIKTYYTPVYMNEEDESKNLLVEIDESLAVKIKGIVIDKDVDGNPLSEVKIEPLQVGDILCPAYVNYNYSVVNVTNDVMDATEIYNEDTYVYGTDFELTYEVMPENSYQYCMKTNYKDDTSTEIDETDYGFFTRPSDVNFANEQIVAVAYKEEDTGSVDGIDYMDCFDFLKQVWKHKKVNTPQELYQAFEHKIDNVEKGYISTWNSLIINKALRTDNYDSLDADDKLTTTTLNGMCEKVSSTKDYLMLRKVSADYLTNVFGVKALNGETLTDDMVKNYTDAEKQQLEDNLQSIVGYKMTEKGFMSASILPYVNIIFGRTVEIIIKVPAGSKYYVSHNVVESEAVFLTNTQLTVDSVEYNESKEKYTIIATLSQNQ